MSSNITEGSLVSTTTTTTTTTTSRSASSITISSPIQALSTDSATVTNTSSNSKGLPNDDPGLGKTDVIAIAASCTILIAIIIILVVVCLVRRRRRRRPPKPVPVVNDYGREVRETDSNASESAGSHPLSDRQCRSQEPREPPRHTPNTHPIMPPRNDLNTHPIMPPRNDLDTHPTMPPRKDLNTHPIMPPRDDLNTHHIMPPLPHYEDPEISATTPIIKDPSYGSTDMSTGTYIVPAQPPMLGVNSLMDDPSYMQMNPPAGALEGLRVGPEGGNVAGEDTYTVPDASQSAPQPCRPSLGHGYVNQPASPDADSPTGVYKNIEPFVYQNVDLASAALGHSGLPSADSWVSGARNQGLIPGNRTGPKPSPKPGRITEVPTPSPKPGRTVEVPTPSPKPNRTQLVPSPSPKGHNTRTKPSPNLKPAKARHGQSESDKALARAGIKAGNGSDAFSAGHSAPSPSLVRESPPGRESSSGSSDDETEGYENVPNKNYVNVPEKKQKPAKQPELHPQYSLAQLQPQLKAKRGPSPLTKPSPPATRSRDDQKVGREDENELLKKLQRRRIKDGTESSQ